MSIKNKNFFEIPNEFGKSIVVGWNKFYELLKTLKPHSVLAFDGFPGVDFSFVHTLSNNLKEKGFCVEIIDGFSLYKSPRIIWEMIEPFIAKDPFFGKIFNGNLKDFLDLEKISETKKG